MKHFAAEQKIIFEEVYMKQKSNLREFIQYTSLNVLGMIGLSCYILADTFFISKGLGTKGLTALNLAIPIYSFVHGIGLMIGMGGAAKYSVFRAQQADRNADKIFSITVYLAILTSILFMLAGAFFSEEIAAVLRADAEVFDMTKIYLQVILLFAPAFIMNDVLLCFVRNDENPGLAMTAMLIGSLANIILDYSFIFLLHMGIFGAVLATGSAPVISMCILSKHWITKRNRFHLKKVKPSPALVIQIFSLGFPSLITEVASGIVILVFNSIILYIEGNTGVAAYSVIANLSLVVTSVCTGIAQGMQPIISRAHGYNEKGVIKELLRYAMITMLFVSCVVYLIFFAAANPIVSVFNSEKNIQLQQSAVFGLKLYFAAVPFAGFNILLSMYFISIEKAIPAQIVSLLRGLFLIIPMAFLLSAFAGMTGIWLTYPITEGIVMIVGILLYLKVLGQSEIKKSLQ